VTTAFVLSGGANLGAAQVGVLTASGQAHLLDPHHHDTKQPRTASRQRPAPIRRPT
jgi:hypothetical protein